LGRQQNLAPVRLCSLSSFQARFWRKFWETPSSWDSLMWPSSHLAEKRYVARLDAATRAILRGSERAGFLTEGGTLMLRRPILIFLVGWCTGGLSVALAVSLGLVLAYSQEEQKDPIRQFKRPVEERPNLPMPRMPVNKVTSLSHIHSR